MFMKPIEDVYEFNSSPHIESRVEDVRTMKSKSRFMSHEAAIKSMQSKSGPKVERN